MEKIISILNNVYRLIDKTSSSDIDCEKGYFLFHKNRYCSILYILLKLVKKRKGAKVLDIGSLFCHLPIAINMLNHKAYGVDLELRPEIIERCNKFDIINKKCNLSEMKIPFKDNYFDLVIFSETLEHLNFYPQEIFKDIYRILKPGGIIIVTTPNLLRLNNRIKMLIGKSINYDIKDKYSTATHFREYSSKELFYLMKSANFKNLNIYYKDFNYPSNDKFIIIINKIFGFLMPYLRSNLIVIGSKK
ncbi:MAG: class I SAM-dependent methyltransferase [Patescibacteria group bacterium]